MPSASLNLSDLNGSNGFAIKDPKTRYSTVRVSRTGDINGDGFTDLLVKTAGVDYDYDPVVNRTYVVFGGMDVGAGGSIDLSSLDGSKGFMINHANAYNDYFSKSISSDSDINGDGITDLIIGHYRANLSGASNAGSVYVVFGGTTVGASGSINLSSLNGSDGFALKGTRQFDLLGSSIISDTDINADGINDLIITAPLADPNGVTDAGSVYVVYGGKTAGADGSIDLSSFDGSNGFALNGIRRNHNLGYSINSDNDINADGITDLIIGVPGADPKGVKDAGCVYVLFGGTNLGAGGSINLSKLNGSNGFVINGINQSDLLSTNFINDSDINGDGINDLIIGDAFADPNGVDNAGSIYVLFGGTNLGVGGSIDLSNLNGSNGFAINGINQSDYLGSSIINYGDINGDGITDIIIGDSDADPNGVDNAGSIYVVYGGTNLGAGGSIDFSNLDGSNGFVINGINPSDRLGNSNRLKSSIRSDNDINGDGITDLIISAPFADPNGAANAGSVYVLFGGTTTGAGGSIDLSNLDGSNGFAINGIKGSDYLGISILSIFNGSDVSSDINGDGINDLIISADAADPNGVKDAGSAYVVYGGTTTGAGGSIDLSNLDGNNGFVINGIHPSDRLGSSIVGAGDINNDGIDDVIINGGSISRTSYVLFGSTTFQPSPNAANDQGITVINTAATLNVLANDSDLNGNPVQINTFSTTSTKGGTVTLDDNGTPTDLTDDQLVYTPPSDFIGFDSFSYTIDNTQGNRATATVNIGVYSQVGTSNDDTLLAGNTRELIRGAAGNDLITGGDGNDQLWGNYGNDTLIGGLGNDILYGGWGHDVLTGGEGSDRFWLVPNRGRDTITDFEDGVDKLVLFNNLTFGQLSISQSNNNALIRVTNTGEELATLTGIQANLLTAKDFVSSTITFG